MNISQVENMTNEIIEFLTGFSISFVITFCITFVILILLLKPWKRNSTYEYSMKIWKGGRN
jgi:predicted PurR-regulated permease PerM